MNITLVCNTKFIPPNPENSILDTLGIGYMRPFDRSTVAPADSKDVAQTRVVGIILCVPYHNIMLLCVRLTCVKRCYNDIKSENISISSVT